jgi:hypothetical protein
VIAVVSTPVVMSGVIFSIAIIGALVLIYLYTFSSAGKGASDLQDKANDALKQIVEALQAKVELLEEEHLANREKIAQLEATNTEQAARIASLQEQVTQAAKVDSLRVELGEYHAKVENKWTEVLSHLEKLTATE